MLAQPATLSAVELYSKLATAFEVAAVYKVSFNKGLSKDVLDVILDLKGNLNPEDIAPNFPTSLTLIVKLPGELQRSFHQDSNTYMDVFDKDNFKNFLLECLALLPSQPDSNSN
jgi:hypothetical protein